MELGVGFQRGSGLEMPLVLVFGMGTDGGVPDRGRGKRPEPRIAGSGLGRENLGEERDDE